MLSFFTKTNGNNMTFSTQIMFEPFRCLLKDVLLLFKIQDSAFFNPLAYPVFSLIPTVFKSIWAEVFTVVIDTQSLHFTIIHEMDT